MEQASYPFLSTQTCLLACVRLIEVGQGSSEERFGLGILAALSMERSKIIQADRRGRTGARSLPTVGIIS